MEVHKAIIIDSWNEKLQGVTISCKEKHVYMIFHMINCSPHPHPTPHSPPPKKKIKASVSKLFTLYHTALSSKELKTTVNINQVNIYSSINFSVSHFAKWNHKNDKGNIIFWCIQGTICKSLKCKVTIFLSKFDHYFIKNQR